MLESNLSSFVCVVLEYLVPSTGKLYHHKMKLRQLKGDTKTEEVIDYLRKRHPLYFIADKISPEQITDLIERLKYKIKQLESAKQPVSDIVGTKRSDLNSQSKKENDAPTKSSGGH
jgi:centrosomal protein CEP19